MLNTKDIWNLIFPYRNDFFTPKEAMYWLLYFPLKWNSLTQNVEEPKRIRWRAMKQVCLSVLSLSAGEANPSQFQGKQQLSARKANLEFSVLRGKGGPVPLVPIGELDKATLTPNKLSKYFFTPCKVWVARNPQLISCRVSVGVWPSIPSSQVSHCLAVWSM